MKKIRVVVSTMVLVLSAQADPIFYDDFEDGALATGGAGTVNAGFFEIDNGGPGQAGSVEETGGVARLSSGSTKNVYGMLSATSVSLASPEGVRSTGNVVGYSLKDSISYMAFNFQTSSSYDDTPEVQVLLNMTNGQVTVTSDGVEVAPGGSFDVNLFAGEESFSIVLEYTPDQLEFVADFKDNGLTDITFVSGWNSGISPLKAATTYHHGIFVNGEGNSAVVADVGDILTEPIPEPAVISLIGIFGGGMIFSRRIFGRKRADIDL
jgi:hypothetical protein